MELLKLFWDIAKTLWDVIKTLGPYVSHRFRLRRTIWPKLVRQGARSIGTPAAEIERLLLAFDNEAFFIAMSHHPIIDEIRHSIWQVRHRLDELRLLAVAEQGKDIHERCWAVNQIGQRAGAYALPVLQSLANSLQTPEVLKKAALRAISEVSLRQKKKAKGGMKV